MAAPYGAPQQYPNMMGAPQQQQPYGYPGAYIYPQQGSEKAPSGPSYVSHNSAHAQYQYPYGGPPPPPVVVQSVVIDVVGPEGGPGTGTAYRGTSKYIDALDKSVRLGFIRKVYLILAAQLFVTFGMVAVFTFSEPVKKWVQSSPVVLYSAIGLSFGFLIALACCDGIARRWPTNMLCLAGFTVTEGYLVGALASFYSTDAVIKAVFATFIVTLALTAYAWQTKVDFTGMGGAMLCLIVCLMLFGIWTAIFPSQVARTAYAALGAFVFSLFIVYDTQMIIGGSHNKHRFEVDEYVFAALNLYLDIINLFLSLVSSVQYQCEKHIAAHD